VADGVICVQVALFASVYVDEEIQKNSPGIVWLRESKETQTFNAYGL